MGFILFLAVFILHISATCPKYECKSTMVFPSDSICLYMDNLLNTFYANPCKGDYACQSLSSSSSECVYQSPYKPATQVAGTKCMFDEDCVTNNICYKGKCKGYDLNSPCSSHLDCGIGLYCSNNVCIKQIKIGHTGCTSDDDCVNSAGCRIYSLKNLDLNLCVKYFSLPDNTALLSCSDTGDVNYLCQSGFCMNIGNSSICYTSPKLAKKSPALCTSNDDCISTPTGELGLLFYSTCGCGYNPEGNMVCSLLYNDPFYNSYDSMVREWFDSDDMEKCNTLGRFGHGCMETYWSRDKLKEFTYKEIRALSYQQVEGGVPDCVLETIYPNYTKSSSSNSVLMVLEIFSLILVLN